MTVYLLLGGLVMLIGIYLYAKREGFRSHALDSLERGNKVSNKVNNQNLKTDDETNKKVKLFSGNNAVNFWMRRDGSKKSQGISNPNDA
jgi:hypothetical protein